MDTTNLDWAKVQTETAQIPKLPITWENFGVAWELKREVFRQGLHLPTATDWNYPIFEELLFALRDFGQKLLSTNLSSHTKANLAACLEEIECDWRVANLPPNPELEAKLHELFGTQPELEEGEEWKAG